VSRLRWLFRASISISTGAIRRMFFSISSKEADIRLVGDSCRLHCLYKIIRLIKTSSLAQIIPFKQDYDLIRFICIAKKMCLLGATGLSSSCMLIENVLPLGVIHNLVPNDHVWRIMTPLRSVYRFSLTKGRLNAF
jgi:hypothetical protein